MALQFEWDWRKARSNLSKHAVSFEEAATVFGDMMSITIADPDHSIAEQRFVTISAAFSGRLLVVVRTERGDNIRLISACRASRREWKSYEKKNE